MGWSKAIEDIEYVKSLADEMGGDDRVQRQHDGGRYTVRGRMEKFCDPGSFLEMGHLVGAAEYDAEGNLVDFSPGGYGTAAIPEPSTMPLVILALALVSCFRRLSTCRC